MSWLTEQLSLLNEFLSSDFRRLVRRCALGMLLAALLGFLASVLWAERPPWTSRAASTCSPC